MKWNIMRQSWNEKKISKSLKECWITQIKLVQFYKQKLNAQASTATVSEEDIELDNTIKNAITSTIATNQKFSRYGSNCKGQLIFVALFSEELLNGCCLPFLIGNAKSWLQRNVFVPWNILKAIDLAGGSLNYKGIEVLWQVESEGKKYYRSGIIPCTADINHASKMIENKADAIVPFTEFQS